MFIRLKRVLRCFSTALQNIRVYGLTDKYGKKITRSAVLQWTVSAFEAIHGAI